MKFRVLLVFVLFVLSGHAQVTEQELSITAATTRTGNIISWTLFSGFTCQGTVLEHSTDSVNYKAIWDEPGVCGNLSSAQSYGFKHDITLNGKHYYRLFLGNRGYSKVFWVERTAATSGNVQIQPHPVREGSKIIFPNPAFDTFSIKIFNSQGAIVFSENMLRGEEYIIPTGVLTHGLYHYLIEGLSQNMIKGNMLVE